MVRILLYFCVIFLLLSDDEVFLMMLLQSMGACQIETEGDPNQSIDDVIERAFDALAMRQEERDATFGDVMDMPAGLFAEDGDSDEEGGGADAAPTSRRLSKAGSMRGSILAPAPRRMSTQQGKARAGSIAKRKRASVKSFSNPTTVKGKHRMKVNEMVAEGKISLEQVKVN